MKKTLTGILFLVVFLLIVLMFKVGTAHAECTFVWKPGDTTFVQAGHNVTMIVESENVEAYKHQKQIDARLLPLPPMDNNFDKAIRSMAHTHVCGDYREVEDVDVE